MQDNNRNTSIPDSDGKERVMSASPIDKIKALKARNIPWFLKQLQSQTSKLRVNPDEDKNGKI